MRRGRRPIDALARLLAEATAEERRILRDRARAQCWRAGDLRWKLDANQKGLYDAFYGNARKRFVLECARRLGKSYLLCVLAMEACLRRPGARAVYGAPTIKEGLEIVVPILDELRLDAPPEVSPVWRNGQLEFPGGSRLVLFGCDDKRQANRGRGPGADWVGIDEAGFIDILSYVLHSVVNPQTLTTGGRVVLASTPSDVPDHDFTRIAEQAEADGNYAHREITDNPRLTPAQIADYVANDAADLGMTVDEYQRSDTYQREHLAKRVVDRTLVVMGEDWTLSREAALVEVPRPQFWDAYEALDMGGVDPHAVLFGYWHFERSWLVIEDELLLREGQNTAQLAEAIREKEGALWGVSKWEGTLKALHEERTDERMLALMPDWLKAKVHASEAAPLQPYLRVCDNDIQIARDLSVLHGISYLPTEKTDKRWYVNEFRVLMRQGRVKIDPRCRNLDRHLRSTVWLNPHQADYKRKGGEHGDLLDCAVYMTRNLRQNRNPTPANYGVDLFTQHVRKQREVNPLKKAFRLVK